MKFVAAYLMACLGAESAAAAAAAAEEGGAVAAPAAARPSKEDVLRILGSVGAEADDDDRLDLLLAQLEGKDVAELIAAGREQLAYAPSGAAAVAVAAAGPAAAAEAKEDKEEEKKKEEEEEEDDNMFNLFDDE